MVGFGLGRKWGTAGAESNTPPPSPSLPGGILIPSVGLVVFLGDLEIYFFEPLSGPPM